jgi:general secretion pathway protein J
VMALLAIMSWRGLDAMLRAQQAHARVTSELSGLQTGLAQWTLDLDMLFQTPDVSAIEWDAQVLRLTRRAPLAGPDGVVVVAWTRRLVSQASADGAARTAPQWVRWQSGVLRTQGELKAAWQQAGSGPGGAGAPLMPGQVAVVPLAAMGVQYLYRGAWFDAADPAARGGVAGPSEAPDGVRLVLELAPDAPLKGTISSDWANPAMQDNPT